MDEARRAMWRRIAGDDLARREFLKCAGAAIGLAGLGACTRAPRDQIVPYVTQPPEVTPGVPRFYASALTLDGYATGVLVESHEGRPTKIEGNPDHPASLGATTAAMQASVLSVYDPARASGVMRRGVTTTWQAMVDAVARAPWRENQGRGLWILMEPTTSPTMADQIARLRAAYPQAKVVFHSAFPESAAWEGAALAFGRPLASEIVLRGAEIVVALDADLLHRGPSSVRLAREWAQGRRIDAPPYAMSRLYAIEPRVTPTGSAADHRVAVRASDVPAFCAALLAEIAPKELGALAGQLRGRADGKHPALKAIAKDLDAHRGASVVVAGPEQPAIVHAMTLAMNAALGNVGRTITLLESPIVDAGAASHDLGPLVRALDAGEVDTLVLLADDPAYTAPELASRIARARQSVYLAHYPDGTAEAATFVVAAAHELESWGDARAPDGTATIVQPLIEPMNGGKTAFDVFAALLGETEKDARTMVRARWAEDLRASLARGVVEGTRSPAAPASVRWDRLRDTFARQSFAPAAAGQLELVLHPDPRLYDGRFAPNPWLLELPEPITKLTWTNAAVMGPETAARLGLSDGDEVELVANGHTARLPATIVPGTAGGTIAVALGWGRRGSVGAAAGAGVDAYPLRSPLRLVSVKKTGARISLPVTQRHHGLEGRDGDILPHMTLAELAKNPRALEEKNKRTLSLYDVKLTAKKQWGMTIDPTACTSCGACVVACQAENNIPTVGREGVEKAREMHWLRIDSYRIGEDLAHQPMLCQHCERAPCEYVCPVNATTHSDDGLNQMVYNRCVGTRFCSNNCPYKVRRFNWFNYQEDAEPLVQNPDVTVRARGVMEKCTFCVQRIREAEIQAAKSGGAWPEFQTACQQACPTRAIVFGDLADAGSLVARGHRNARAYAALRDLGTEPRVRYLARIWNKNPEL